MTDTFSPKAVSIRAIQFTGTFDSAQAVQAFAGDGPAVTFIQTVKAIHPPLVNIQDPATGAVVTVQSGWWAIVDPSGAVRTMTADAFAATYEVPASS